LPENITHYRFTEYGLNAIVTARFLDRGLGDAIIGGYKLDALLFYQAFRDNKQTEINA
jgi:hypothetical protein